MRSNCCCDSHSTTRRASCKKGSTSSAAGTQACSSRVQRLEARGQGVGAMVSSFRKVCGFAVHPETRFQKSVFLGAAFSGSVWMVGQPCVFMWTASKTRIEFLNQDNTLQNFKNLGFRYG